MEDAFGADVGIGLNVDGRVIDEDQRLAHGIVVGPNSRLLCILLA